MEPFFPNSNDANAENYVVPEGVEIVDDNAFEGCSSLQEIVLSESVKEMRTYAFDDCDSPTIYAPKGSYTERYARENNIKFELFGYRSSKITLFFLLL